MPLFKSKQRKELERDIQYRQGIARVRGFVKRTKEIQAKYWKAGKKALHMNDQPRFERFAKAYLSCDAQIRKWQSLLLDLEMIGVRRDQVKASASFISSIKALSGSMLAQAAPNDLANLHVEMDQALAHGEALDQALSVVMEMSGDQMLGLDEPEGEEDLAGVEAAMKSEMNSRGTDPLDDRIEDGLKQIEQKMRSQNQ